MRYAMPRATRRAATRGHITQRDATRNGGRETRNARRTRDAVRCKWRDARRDTRRHATPRDARRCTTRHTTRRDATRRDTSRGVTRRDAARHTTCDARIRSRDTQRGGATCNAHATCDMQHTKLRLDASTWLCAPRASAQVPHSAFCTSARLRVRASASASAPRRAPPGAIRQGAMRRERTAA